MALFSRFANAYKCNSLQYSPSLADIRNSALSDSTMLVPLWLREESATEVCVTYSNKFVLFAACSDDIAFKCLEFVFSLLINSSAVRTRSSVWWFSLPNTNWDMARYKQVGPICQYLDVAKSKKAAPLGIAAP